MTSQLLIVAQQQGAGGLMATLYSLTPLILIFGIFYLLVIMPMNKRQKELKALVDNLSKGDKVYTNGGLYGTVVRPDGPILVLEIADGVKIRVARSAIAGLEGEGAGANEKKGS